MIPRLRPYGSIARGIRRAIGDDAVLLLESLDALFGMRSVVPGDRPRIIVVFGKDLLEEGDLRPGIPAKGSR